MTDFTVTEPRSRVMTFSSAIDMIYHAVFIQNPEKAYNYESYTAQFTYATWLTISFWIITTPLILYVVARCLKITYNIYMISYYKKYTGAN